MQKMQTLVESLEKISARLLETVVLNNQLASSQTPELRDLFHKWVDCLTLEITAVAEEGGDIDVAAMADRLGISPSSLLSLLLAQVRRGDIVISSLRLGKGDGTNQEICGCLR